MRTNDADAGVRTREPFLQGFYIDVCDVPDQPDVPARAHAFTELAVICEGQGIYCCDGDEYPVAAGDVIVIHAGQRYAYRETRKLYLRRVLFDREQLGLDSLNITHFPGFYALFILDPDDSPNAGMDSLLHLGEKQLRRTRELIDELQRELIKQNPGFKMVTQHLLLFLIGKLGRWYNQINRNHPESDPRITRSIRYMEQEFYEALTVEELAQKSNMSERAYYRAFQKATGVSPNQYLNSLRLSQACELLKHSRMSVTEVALECGFQSGSYMNRLFKKHLDITPLSYRKMNKV
ncbi:HTH-type transcriptional activator RhaR [Pontiella desulfatans]|uniref:HTH-type transcriptional activator RhaR n=1 Tax=Pontiella desulfatans TaxID=2750659 RepID=A0A6C2U2E5_PONDE|nr:AraC family transcriptional regulator [Pontiella desulfatans]VGO14015.1 HTH-type transcriptional activator RhaR [Pontiella desulfatans]